MQMPLNRTSHFIEQRKDVLACFILKFLDVFFWGGKPTFRKSGWRLQNSGFDSAFLRLQLCELRASLGWGGPDANDTCAGRSVGAEMSWVPNWFQAVCRLSARRWRDKGQKHEPATNPTLSPNRSWFIRWNGHGHARHVPPQNAFDRACMSLQSEL